MRERRPASRIQKQLLVSQGLSLSNRYGSGPIRTAVVQGVRGEAKFWIEPEVQLAQDYGLGPLRVVNRALRLIREHEDEIRAAWQTHFGR